MLEAETLCASCFDSVPASSSFRSCVLFFYPNRDPPPPPPTRLPFLATLPPPLPAPLCLVSLALSLSSLRSVSFRCRNRSVFCLKLHDTYSLFTRHNKSSDLRVRFLLLLLFSSSSFPSPAAYCSVSIMSDAQMKW